MGGEWSVWRQRERERERAAGYKSASTNLCPGAVVRVARPIESQGDQRDGDSVD